MNETVLLPWAEASGFVSTKSGDVGIELEIEGENLPREVSGWIAKHEGSLRGKGGRTPHQGESLPDTPMEYVLYRPTGMHLLLNKLKALNFALTTNGATVALTPRASTHIHVNMTAERVRTVLGFIIIFTAIEPVLLRLCGPHRNGNLFCLPSYETGELHLAMEKMVTAIHHGIRRNWPTKRGRYAALNIDALSQFGSLEVRCFPNTIDAETIYKWAQWLVGIRQMARDQQDVTYMGLLNKAYDDPRWLLTQVFGNEDLFTPCQPNSPYDLLAFGIEYAYEVAKAALPALSDTVKPKPLVKAQVLDDWYSPPELSAPPDFSFDDEPEDN